MQSDIKASVFVAADSPDTVVNHRARLRGMSYISSASAGSIVFKDGASGATLLELKTPAGVGQSDVIIPDQGILFSNQIYCTLTNVTAVTVFHS